MGLATFGAISASIIKTLSLVKVVINLSLSRSDGFLILRLHLTCVSLPPGNLVTLIPLILILSLSTLTAMVSLRKSLTLTRNLNNFFPVTGLWLTEVLSVCGSSAFLRRLLLWPECPVEPFELLSLELLSWRTGLAAPLDAPLDIPLDAPLDDPKSCNSRNSSRIFSISNSHFFLSSWT